MARLVETKSHARYETPDILGISVSREEALKIIQSLAAQLDDVPGAMALFRIQRQSEAGERLGPEQRLVIVVNDPISGK